jgi:hypothetical protein
VERRRGTRASQQGDGQARAACAACAACGTRASQQGRTGQSGPRGVCGARRGSRVGHPVMPCARTCKAAGSLVGSEPQGSTTNLLAWSPVCVMPLWCRGVRCVRACVCVGGAVERVGRAERHVNLTLEGPSQHSGRAAGAPPAHARVAEDLCVHVEQLQGVEAPAARAGRQHHGPRRQVQPVGSDGAARCVCVCVCVFARAVCVCVRCMYKVCACA